MLFGRYFFGCQFIKICYLGHFAPRSTSSCHVREERSLLLKSDYYSNQ